MKNETFPVRLDDQSIDELATLYACGEYSLNDCPSDDLVEEVINLLSN